MIKKILRSLLPNPFDQLLKKTVRQEQKRFLLFWNRGLGDIALGLYAMVKRIHDTIPNASITFITREDLKEGFALLASVQTLTTLKLKRGMPFSREEIFVELNLRGEDFDVIIEKPDPTYWVKWQLGTVQPKLVWDPAWDKTSPLLDRDKKYIAIHVDSETTYGYEKNWSKSKWDALFSFLEKKQMPCFLLGKAAKIPYAFGNIVDLRGKTNLIEALSLIKNRSSHFIGPDSGILSLLYFLNAPFPIKAISLWADPHQGILKQNVASPNPELMHIPLIAKDKILENLAIDEVIKVL